ncbi:Voltage-gated potassium channel Kch [Posidoniimonas polymericola]|uniref:Voltage-gated potassium channel Kch n=1 Tax=Posidoniimonas polymericola TaxID=2528002 RepID=A0A5C5YQ95_9BACT|nr:Voltage-gated potassium channel Kch [Posidoniimonas polymericola]
MLLVTSVVSYKLVTNAGWLESFYFFVITASTVGYGERSTVSPEVQLLTIAIIMTSSVTVAYTLGVFIQSMIAGQINQALGVMRMTREIQQLSGHNIICGFGRIGQTLAEEFLRRRADFVVVEKEPEAARDAADAGYLVIAGDATDEETLRDAGVQRAKTLIVALHGDADNVFLTLTARNLSDDLRIIARGELPSTEKKLRQAGANEVVLPAVIGARRMAAMVTRPYAAEMMEHFTNHERIDAGLEEITIVAGSPLAGQSVREVAARQRHNLLVVGIRKADGLMVFNPNPDDPLETGDTLIVLGNIADIREFQSSHKL